MKWILKLISSLLILAICAAGAGFVVYSFLTPEQQQKVRRYLNDRGRSYEPGAGSRTFEKTKAKWGDVLQRGGERTFNLKNGQTLSGKVNFETDDAYSVTLSDGNRIFIPKSDVQ